MFAQETLEEKHRIDGLTEALDALGQTIGLPIKGRIVRLEPTPKMGYRPDAIIDIVINGEKYRHVVEMKTKVDRLAAIGHLKTQLGRFGERGLLFAPYITAAIAKKCREQ